MPAISRIRDSSDPHGTFSPSAVYVIEHGKVLGFVNNATALHDNGHKSHPVLITKCSSKAIIRPILPCQKTGRRVTIKTGAPICVLGSRPPWFRVSTRGRHSSHPNVKETI
jgi:hypothetical protein